MRLQFRGARASDSFGESIKISKIITREGPIPKGRDLSSPRGMRGCSMKNYFSVAFVIFLSAGFVLQGASLRAEIVAIDLTTKIDVDARARITTLETKADLAAGQPRVQCAVRDGALTEMLLVRDLLVDVRTDVKASARANARVSVDASAHASGTCRVPQCEKNCRWSARGSKSDFEKADKEFDFDWEQRRESGWAKLLVAKASVVGLIAKGYKPVLNEHDGICALLGSDGGSLEPLQTMSAILQVYADSLLQEGPSVTAEPLDVRWEND
ncbi:MAG: hypothetical protein HY547_05425 [Elusimicrobia bacterium]|nr:hypothetical protein [Elusimicrobiota bacterium]